MRAQTLGLAAGRRLTADDWADDVHAGVLTDMASLKVQALGRPAREDPQGASSVSRPTTGTR